MSTRCNHCQLPVPPALIKSGETNQFCCRGCETAFQIIHENGLDAFYRMSDLAAKTVSTNQDRTFEEFDSDEFLESFAQEINSQTWEIRFVLEGIHCAACVWLLEKLPDMISGVLSVRVNWSQSLATVQWEPEVVSLSRIASQFAELGYTPHVSRKNGHEETVRRENRTHLVRLAVAGAAAGNNMLIAAALYFGMFQTMTESVELLLRWASCLIGVASLLLPGRIFFQGAWAAIRTRTPHMDLPVALGLSIGGIAGLWNTITNSGEIYFDSLSALVFLLLLGRWIQYRQQVRAANAIDLLHQVTPQLALKKVLDRFVPTPLNLIESGDTVLVRSGETIPVDGPVTKGTTAIDESILTGEAIPRMTYLGQHVYAGSLNLKDAIEVKAERTQSETRIGKLFDLVQQTSQTKPPIVQLADRIGGWFVMVVISISLAVLGVWLVVDPTHAFDHCVSLLIVACPCALALATPLAISVALGRAARAGILIKSGDVLQTLDQPGEIWLDKTGTLTQGRMQVIRWENLVRSQDSDSSIDVQESLGLEESQELLRLVGEIEKTSSHPVAIAISRFVEEQQHPELSSDLVAIEKVEQTATGGIFAKTGGSTIHIGNKQYVAQVANFSNRALEIEKEFIDAGTSPTFVSVDGVVVMVFAVGDPVRSDAGLALKQLRSMGWQVGILSGDHQSIVEQVGASLKVSRSLCHGSMMPEQKMDFIRSRTKGSSTVVMVGDGVNDSAALAVASVGIAAHGGAQASLQAAPVYLANAGLLGVVQLFQGGQQTLRAIKRNFAASLAYNVFAVSLAAAGMISPLVAAVLMPISSLTVVGLSLASRSFPIRATGLRSAQLDDVNQLAQFVDKPKVQTSLAEVSR